MDALATAVFSPTSGPVRGSSCAGRIFQFLVFFSFWAFELYSFPLTENFEVKSVSPIQLPGP
jgi:hypothetical protein